MKLPINKTHIASLVPHAGDMCLIDEVTRWNDKQIECIARLSARSHHPLCLDGELSALHLLEYGAQAMAVHAGLLRRTIKPTPVPGFLAAIRDAQLFIDSLTDCAYELQIRATALIYSAHGVIYELEVTDAQQTVLAQARTTVIHIDPSEVR